MKSHAFTPAAMATTLLLAACATPQDYPSLAVRDSERVSGSFAVPPAPAFTPAPPSGETLAQLGELAASARAAHQRFLAAADETRGPVQQAAGAQIGSLEWSRAQAAIAALQATRGDAIIALADIDRLYVTAAVEGNELDAVGQARGEVAGMVEAQDELLAAMLGTVGS